MNAYSIAICIPVRNAGVYASEMIQALRNQTVLCSKLVIVDSSSTDGSLALFSEIGAEIHVIPAEDFDHGATRQFAVEMAKDVDIVVFLTQDAIPQGSDAIEKIIECFDDPDVAAAYGRQLPRADASPVAAHARYFNYPASNTTKSRSDIPSLGIKAAFISNSFAAYRRCTLMETGGFPRHVIFGEDTCIAARMILAGYKIAYRGDAQVVHSHNYSIFEEFRRYFDIGVMHAIETWLLKSFGKPEGEGKRFVTSEISYLRAHSPLLIPTAVFRTISKYAGYRLGLFHARIPLFMRIRMSLNKSYWL